METSLSCENKVGCAHNWFTALTGMQEEEGMMSVGQSTLKLLKKNLQLKALFSEEIVMLYVSWSVLF